MVLKMNLMQGTNQDMRWLKICSAEQSLHSGICLFSVHNSHLSSPNPISNSVPLVYLLTYFGFLCLLLTSLFHLFFWFIFPLYFPLQLPEPLILFRYYNDFIGLAKESQSIIVEELEALRLSPTPVTPAQVSVELNRVLFKIKDLLRQLPLAHYKTLQFLIEHLHR